MRLALVEEVVICKVQLNNAPLVDSGESVRVSQMLRVQQPCGFWPIKGASGSSGR